MDSHSIAAPEFPSAPASHASFEVFDLSITLGPGFVPWVSAASRLGHVHGVPRSDPALPAIADLLDSTYDFVDAVRFAERDSLADLRRALGQLAFGEPAVAELFQATRGVAADHGREVLLRILASPHLAALPWELLPDPGQGDEHRGDLALAPDVSLVRLARGRNYPIRVDPLEPPLNLLLVLSSPSGLTAQDDSLLFDIYEERRSLLAELKPLQDAGLLHIDVEDRPTLYNVRRRIGEQRRGYHLFHYIGHAEPDRLILEDESGRREEASGSSFMEVLRLCPDLRLAVFAGCETARAGRDPLSLDLAGAGGWRHILSLADRCVQASSPVVVGMQAVLAFRTERLFTRFFYQGVASGYSIPAAMRLARGATRGDRHVGGGRLDWAVPVLFLGGDEPGPLLDPKVRGEKPQPPARHVLRLGLQQRDARFFARDVALRQAIDVLDGTAPERVLVVTGPSSVGKTMLIDRALEEIHGPVCILYLRLSDLRDELAVDSVRLLSRDGKQGACAPMRALAELSPQAPLMALSKLVSELMERADGRHREPGVGQSASDWWLRLFEDLAAARFVLVIDEVDVLVRLKAPLSEGVQSWLRQAIKRCSGMTESRPMFELLEELAQHVEWSSGTTRSPFARANPLLEDLASLREALGDGWDAGARTTLAKHARAMQRHPQDSQEVVDGVGEKAHAEEWLRWCQDAHRGLVDLTSVLDKALRLVADRRGGMRLALVAETLPEDLLALPNQSRFLMRLGRLTWGETRRWVRRNLPGLLRFGEDALQRLWLRFAADLELWEELERLVMEPGNATVDLEALADRIAPGRSLNQRPGIDPRPRAQRPLRVAVAGPHILSEQALATAITRMAAENGVGGQAVDTLDAARGSLARLVQVPSPFDAMGMASQDEMRKFLLKVLDEEPDIVLLDYGQDVRLPLPEVAAERGLLRLLGQRALLVAAGGTRDSGSVRGSVSVPGAYKEVLSVGPCDENGRLRPYAMWSSAISKPDFFMDDQLLGTRLQEALKADVVLPEGAPLGPGTHGSSFSALHAVAAAILVWAIWPDLTLQALRNQLLRACAPSDGTRIRARMLTVPRALAHARIALVRHTLRGGPCALMELAAITGLAPADVDVALRALLGECEVRRLTRGRSERYELISAG